ncbi:2-polyprenylphenol hydroxylase [Arthrobacter sp. B1805]|uniref:2-polyprenylphenol hydroxylase n=1 Tax=Arthrobacter sp. B1805 TaxID=2058892 RepID=UPI0021578503|nr:2-polyprenylphenol hydroxylase [Arthrobacter sp. B1805]
MDDLRNTPDDERFFLHNGRRWRTTDPSLPADVKARLMSHLGRGRSGVRNSAKGDDGGALPRARRMVQLAKEGLGERGTPWWEQSADERTARWTAALQELDALHSERPGDATGERPAGAVRRRPDGGPTGG